MDRVVSVSFSPTGGTTTVCDHVAAAIAGTRRGLVLSNRTLRKSWRMPQSFKRSDVVVLGMPVYYGRLPAIAPRYFEYLEGHGARAVLVATYGNREYEDALVELQDLAERSRFRPVAAAAFVAQHTYSPTLGKGRPSAHDMELADRFGRSLRPLLTGKVNLRLPGDRPYRDIPQVKTRPVTDSTCNRCGICVENCPVGAIAKRNPSRIADNCLVCTRCMLLCPNKSKSIETPGFRQNIERIERENPTPKPVEVFYGKRG